MRHGENITTPHSGLLRSAHLPQNTHTSRNTPTQPEKIEKTFKYTPPPTPAEAECSDLPPQASPGVPTGPCPPPSGAGAPQREPGRAQRGPSLSPRRHGTGRWSSSRPVAPYRTISRHVALCRGPAPPVVTGSGSRASARARAAEGRSPPTPRAPRTPIGCRGLSLSPRHVYGSAGRSWGRRGCHVVCPGFAGWSRRPRVRVLPPPQGRAGPGSAVLPALSSLPSRRG